MKLIKCEKFSLWSFSSVKNFYFLSLPLPSLPLQQKKETLRNLKLSGCKPDSIIWIIKWNSYCEWMYNVTAYHPPRTHISNTNWHRNKLSASFFPSTLTGSEIQHIHFIPRFVSTRFIHLLWGRWGLFPSPRFSRPLFKKIIIIEGMTREKARRGDVLYISSEPNKWHKNMSKEENPLNSILSSFYFNAK